MTVKIKHGGKAAPALAGKKQAGAKSGNPGQFKPGQSGNPAGKKPGTLNQSTMLAQALLDGEAEAIMRGVVEDAKRGDPTARRLLVPRLIPPRRSRAINFTLPPTDTAAGIADALDAVITAVASGELALDEAEALSALLQGRLQALEAADLERRLEALESVVEREEAK